MTISVTIDCCAWDFFFVNKYDLCVELPVERFSLFITREVELELLQTPDESKDGLDKRPLKEYIRNSIERSQVQTSCVFGFYCGESPDDPARYGGFGQGTFVSDIEQDWRQREETQRFVRDGHNTKRRASTVLRKNEADVSLAVASLTSVLITVDEKKNASSGKKGPIHDAAINGGRVAYTDDFKSSGLTLANFIEERFIEPNGTS